MIFLEHSQQFKLPLAISGITVAYSATHGSWNEMAIVDRDLLSALSATVSSTSLPRDDGAELSASYWDGGYSAQHAQRR